MVFELPDTLMRDGLTHMEGDMKKYPILLIAWLAPGAASAASLREVLAQKLAEYCIPKDEGGCSAGATAAYSSAGPAINRCGCPPDSVYDRNKRACKSCGACGRESAFSLECRLPSCPADFYMAASDGNSCPEGTYKAAGVKSCPEGFFKLAEGHCPPDTYKYEMC